MMVIDTPQATDEGTPISATPGYSARPVVLSITHIAIQCNRIFVFVEDKTSCSHAVVHATVLACKQADLPRPEKVATRSATANGTRSG